MYTLEYGSTLATKGKKAKKSDYIIAKSISLNE